MTDSGAAGRQPLPRQVPVLLDPRRHQHLREMLDYINAISYSSIDPDRYRWDSGFLKTLSRMLSTEDWEEITLLASHHDGLMIETLADAAATFTRRGDEPLMDNFSSDDCWEFLNWFSTATRGLFESTPPPN